MTQLVLTSPQREQLIAHLNRRLNRLSDNALVQLEQLTRYPERLSGFTPRQVTISETIVQAQVVHTSPNIPEPARAGTRRQVSRRELLAFGTGAVATLLAGITGVGWRNSKNRESKVSALLADLEGLDLDQTISEAIAELDPRIESLNELIQTTHRHKQDDDLTVRNYQSLYMPAQQAIQRLEIAVGNMQGLYTRLSDTGMNSPALMQELLGVINLFPPAREYTGAFNIMLEMVKGIPDFLQNSGAVIREMQAWFSPERGIDALLLQPLQSNLFPHIDELYDQTSTLKDTWERQLVERSTELIRERKRIKEGAAL